MRFYFFKVLLSVIIYCLATAYSIYAQVSVAAFAGEKSRWREGYDRYDYLMDTATLEIRPMKAALSEGFGINEEAAGKVRCLVVLPRNAAEGSPWSWRGFYWDHEPQAELALLKKGFAIAYINCDPGRQWDAWYAFLTEKHGWSRKPAFSGMSRGAINAYAWAVNHPGQVSCIYGDNAAIMPESLAKIAELARHDVPLLNICGSEDFLYEKNTLAIENIYLQLGGRMTVIVKEGTAHHPHSLRNPDPIVDWVTMNVMSPKDSSYFAEKNFTKSYYYSAANTYHFLKEENTYMTCRGPGFAEVYERYEQMGRSRFGISSMSVVLPHKAAPGMPWVFKADRLERDAVIDQALLLAGYAIVVTPLISQSGAVEEEWNEVYEMMISHGFSKKPWLEGSGINAGETYAWAIRHTNQVAGILSINPIFRSLMIKADLFEGLGLLSAAKIPLVIVAGDRDPWFTSNSVRVTQEYKRLGQKVHLLVKKGEGHFIKPDPKKVLNFVK